MSSPRAWGCFRIPVTRGGYSKVFPTCVGVFPIDPGFVMDYARLPHVRGGVSPDLIWKQGRLRSSPRAWGCFY